MASYRLNPDPERDILVVSVRHTGTHFIERALGGRSCKLESARQHKGGVIQAHFYEHMMPKIMAFNKVLKTVVPLRHPLLIATSWEKRGKPPATGFYREWQRMGQIDAFFFPLDTMPFDELEEFTGKPVIRDTSVINSIGDYPEKHSLEAAREFITKESLTLVEQMLATPIGQRYYGSSP